MKIAVKDIEFFNHDKTVLLSIMQDNLPITLPIWGIIHNDAVYMATDTDSLKVSLINQNPKGSVLVLEEPPGYPWIRIEGKIKLGPVADFPEFSDFREIAELIATKYVGEEKAPDRFPGNNWTILKIVPNKIVSKVGKD